MTRTPEMISHEGKAMGIAFNLVKFTDEQYTTIYQSTAERF